LKAADFGFSDPNDSPANSLLAVKITVLPSFGTLRNNGNRRDRESVCQCTDINGGKLVFTPNTNLVGNGLFLSVPGSGQRGYGGWREWILIRQARS